MEDQDIIALYWAREEDAIRETAAKYGGLCRSIVGRILASPEDGEECLNDTWLGLWNAIPPQRPRRLAAFAGRVARNLALKRYDYVTARRRSPEAVRSLEELGECVSGRETVVEVPAEQESLELTELGLTLILPDSWKGLYELVEWEGQYVVVCPQIREAVLAQSRAEWEADGMEWPEELDRNPFSGGCSFISSASRSL